MSTARHDYVRNVNNTSESVKTSIYKYILAKWQTAWPISSLNFTMASGMTVARVKQDTQDTGAARNFII